jgi:hypothetical protein
MAEKCAREADRMPPGPSEMNFFGKLSCSSPTQRRITGLRRLACSPQLTVGLCPGASRRVCGSNATHAMTTTASIAEDVEFETTVVKRLSIRWIL